jgi:hypothetical protein
MRKIVDFVKMLWQQDKWLFGIFCIGMLAILWEVFVTLDLFYTIFIAHGIAPTFKDAPIWSREHIVSNSWGWAPLIVLAYIYLIGLIALLSMFFYIIFMKIHKRHVNWRRTIILGTMTFWTYILWLIFFLISNFLLRLVFPHLF